MFDKLREAVGFGDGCRSDGNEGSEWFRVTSYWFRNNRYGLGGSSDCAGGEFDTSVGDCLSANDWSGGKGHVFGYFFGPFPDVLSR